MITEIKARDLDNICFQQDDATSHISRETVALLREKFGEQ